RPPLTAPTASTSSSTPTSPPASDRSPWSDSRAKDRRNQGGSHGIERLPRRGGCGRIGPRSRAALLRAPTWARTRRGGDGDGSLSLRAGGGELRLPLPWVRPHVATS